MAKPMGQVSQDRPRAGGAPPRSILGPKTRTQEPDQGKPQLWQVGPYVAVSSDLLGPCPLLQVLPFLLEKAKDKVCTLHLNGRFSEKQLCTCHTTHMNTHTHTHKFSTCLIYSEVLSRPTALGAQALSKISGPAKNNKLKVSNNFRNSRTIRAEDRLKVKIGIATSLYLEYELHCSFPVCQFLKLVSNEAFISRSIREEDLATDQL